LKGRIPLKHVIVDYRISDEEKETLSGLGYKILICPPLKTLYEAVSGHPDMLIHIIDNDTIMVHKDMDETFVSVLNTIGKTVVFSSGSIGPHYPQDILLNAVNLKHIFIHNTKYSDNKLLAMVSGKRVVCVNQGYTKCSTAVLNDKAVITSDTGIAKAMESNGIDVLFLSPGDILLPGLNYGFIGGCCGLLDEGIMGFYGNLKNYAYGEEVLNFLKKYKIEPYFLSRGKLIDRGTIFAI
jgi:hypothetical protein